MNKIIGKLLAEKGNSYENWIEALEEVEISVKYNEEVKRPEWMSQELWNLIKQKEKITEEGNTERIKELQKEIKKRVKLDKKVATEKTVEETLGCRDRWKGIKNIKKTIKKEHQIRLLQIR